MTTELGFEVYPQDLCGVFAWDSAVRVVKKLGEGWRLPTQNELNKMWLIQKEVGGFGANYYWSSSEYTATYAWNQNFSGGYQYYINKNNSFKVRPVRDTLLTRDPDMTIEARLKVDPEFAVALYHEQRKQIAELEAQVPKIAHVVNKKLVDDSDEDCAIYFGECGNCGEGIMPNWEACPICKSELNWEGV